jgi:hypothetical protein
MEVLAALQLIISLHFFGLVPLAFLHTGFLFKEYILCEKVSGVAIYTTSTSGSFMEISALGSSRYVMTLHNLGLGQHPSHCNSWVPSFFALKCWDPFHFRLHYHKLIPI